MPSEEKAAIRPDGTEQKSPRPLAPTSEDTGDQESADNHELVSSREWIEAAERLGKALAAITIAFYVLGLLSVNGYLLRLGVSDFTLIRARFVYTGTLEVLIFLLSFYLPFATYREGRSRISRQLHTDDSTVARWKEGIVPIAALSITYIGVAGLLNGVFGTGRKLTGLEPLFGFVVTLAGLVAGILSLKLIQSIGKAFGSDLKAATRHPYAVWVVVTIFFIIVAYVYVFMSIAYPRIPVQFGGGRPQSTRLLLTKEAVSGARELGLPLSGTSNLTDSLDLMYEGSESYIVQLKNGQIVELRRNLVAGAIVAEGKKSDKP